LVDVNEEMMHNSAEQSQIVPLLALAYQAGRCAAFGEPWACADQATAGLIAAASASAELADASALIDLRAWEGAEISAATRLAAGRLRNTLIYREGWFCTSQGPVLVTCRDGQWWATQVWYDAGTAERQPDTGGVCMQTEPLTAEQYQSLAALFYLADVRRILEDRGQS
jgi:hypothetical protein